MIFIKKQLKPFSLFLLVLGIFLLTGPLPVGAHSFFESSSIPGIGIDNAVWSEHEEASPFKGTATLTVTNSGTEAWGDFHFQIFEVTGFGSVENVDFDVISSPPTSSQSGLTWSVDNDVVGSTLDLYFYSDPVLAGETATFTVYTDNTTDQLSFFGMLYYPTPVPIPSAVWLLGSGLIGLIGFRRKCRE
jgi:hypothetical protein